MRLKAETISLLGFLCASASLANASSLGSYGLVQFSSPSNGGFPPLEQVCFNTAGCSGTAAVFGTTGLNMAYDAFGLPGYGILGGFASQSVSGSIQSGAIPSGMYSVVNGESDFDDTFTVFGAQSGTLGTLTATFTVSGNSSVVSTSGFAGVSMFALEGSNSYNCGNVPGPGTLTCAGIPITFGQGVNIEFQMSTVLNISGFAPGSSATANYADTALLTGIAVSNNGGSAVSGFSIQSGSGTQYTSQGVAPEPATTSLSAIGLMLLVLCARKRIRVRV